MISHRNSISPSPKLDSPKKLLRKESLKRTIRISQQEFDKRVNENLIKFFEKLIIEIPHVLKEIDSIKMQDEVKEKDYMELIDKVLFIF